MPQPAGQSCANCQAFFLDDTTSPPYGKCKFYPPAMVVSSSPPPGTPPQDTPSAYRLLVYADDWCRQWAQAT